MFVYGFMSSVAPGHVKACTVNNICMCNLPANYWLIVDFKYRNYSCYTECVLTNSVLVGCNTD